MAAPVGLPFKSLFKIAPEGSREPHDRYRAISYKLRGAPYIADLALSAVSVTACPAALTS